MRHSLSADVLRQYPYPAMLASLVRSRPWTSVGIASLLAIILLYTLLPDRKYSGQPISNSFTFAAESGEPILPWQFQTDRDERNLGLSDEQCEVRSIKSLTSAAHKISDAVPTERIPRTIRRNHSRARFPPLARRHQRRPDKAMAERIRQGARAAAHSHL